MLGLAWWLSLLVGVVHLMGGDKSFELQGGSYDAMNSDMKVTCLRYESRLQLTWAVGVLGVQPVQASSDRRWVMGGQRRRWAAHGGRSQMAELEGLCIIPQVQGHPAHGCLCRLTACS